MSRKQLIIRVIAVLIVLGSVSIAALTISKPDYFKNFFNKPYSVVYLATGEIYVGKLSTFPRMELDDVYLIQNVRDPNDQTKSSFQLVPLKSALWAPVKLYLNRDQVVFSGPVSETSQVAQTLKNAVSGNNQNPNLSPSSGPDAIKQ